MIVFERPSWWRLLTVWRGSALQRVWPQLSIVTAIAIVLTIVHERERVELGVLTPLPFTIVGLALGIFLGFRNNTSYDRFWEGRKLWGELVNAARTFAREVLLVVDAASSTRPTELQRELVTGIAAFAHVLRQHLRRESQPEEYAHLLRPERQAATAAASHRPTAVLQGIAESLRVAWQAGRIDALHLPVLESTLAVATNVLGGCERIRNTPIPLSSTVLMHSIVAIYVLTLPFGLLETIGPYTPLVVLFTAYAFLGLDAIGDELENPFGLDPNDLPLSTLSRTIEINVREILGDTDLPQPIAANDGVFS